MAPILVQVCDGGYAESVMKEGGRNRGFFTNDPPHRFSSVTSYQVEQWKWSSFRAYRSGEIGPVRVKFQESVEVNRRPVESFAAVESPLIRKVRE
ncbi:MAG: hypothetical protein WA172_04240 [Terriglobales bacterium]